MLLQGILNCYKPVGWTSRDVVNRVYGCVRPAKAGHAGTLDPLADGVLLAVIGAASRLVPYIHLYEKSYRACFELGANSPSADLETTVTRETLAVPPSRQQVAEAAQSLTGRLTQLPPLHSAVKIDGRPAYRAARNDEAVEMRSRQVDVMRFEIVSYDYPHVEAEIVCGSGTYIRSLGVDLAKQLGTVAVMTQLTRTAIGPFRLEDAIDISQRPLEITPAIVAPLATGIGQLGRLELSDYEVGEIEQGRSIRPGWGPRQTSPGDEWAALDPQGRLRAIMIRRRGAWGPKRVFPVQ